MKIFGYWRSSATYRIRIILELKGIPYDVVPVNLLEKQQQGDAYKRVNPTGLVPSLELPNGRHLGQSIAIAEYLEEAHPHPAILPSNPEERAFARMLAATIACEAQTGMNLRIQTYLRHEGGFDDDAILAWLNKWPLDAMIAVDQLITAHGSKTGFALGAEPTMPDAFIVPQVFAAKRFGVDLSQCPRLVDIANHANTHEPFKKAHPDQQPDAPK
ncbi:MAG: maleylacetoacetate isomerase [Pseudomonadota bacterium]